MMKIVAGGASTVLARVDYEYDNYGSSHANLTPRSDIIMHDPAFDPFQETQESCDWECSEWGWTEGGLYECINWQWVCNYYNPYNSATDYRGNVTAVTTYTDAAGASGAITHSTTYDIAGNVMSAQVDCCQLKTFAYSDTYEYAYPTSVTSGVPSGLHLTSSTTYDFNTGLLATATDENSQVTSVSYNPDTLRPSQVDFADGGRTTYDYADALAADSAGKYHSLVTVSTKLDSSRYVDSKRYLDGRGALAATFDSHTSGDGWSITNVEYDNMGRAYRASNPYYSTSNYGTVAINSAGIWSTSTFDQLGRVTQVTMPRGDDANPSYTTSVQTSYAGEVVTVTDQAGKQLRQISDALGRVVRLDEPTTSGLGTVSSPNQSTSYQYDLLNNLVKITQGSQNRYFKYDSLSRLIRERQVEQDTNSSYNLSDSLTGNSSWTKKLEYNSHGLVTHAYDARGIQTDLYYDDLNRVTLIDYSDSTPDARYYYDSQTLPSGAPSYTHGYATGRVIGMTYGSSSSAITGTYFGYDKLGRVTEQRQVTGSNTYSLSYTYNLAGLLATETYPTGRVLTHSYDDAGRLSTISDGTMTFASSLSYAASGGLLSETWGNSAVHSIAYNNALQVSQIKLKQSSSGSELQRYDYLYGEVTQSSGSVDKSKNNGQLGRVDGIINGSSTKEWEQRFSYDELGRLSTAAEYHQGGSTQNWQQQFTYDRYGNRFQSGSGNTGVGITPVVSSDITAGTNRFISTGSTPITYDAAGNITQDAKFRLMNYGYDANGRQTSASVTNSDLSQTSVYDCAGQRVQTTAFSVTRTMVYDIFGQLVADYNGTSMEKENIYRGGQLLAVYAASSSCYMTIADFVTAFYQGALNRNPNSTELTDWTLKLSQAQAPGSGPAN
jgi:YD repeat-containing protein